MSYVVRPGDTLWAIAARLGVSLAQLIAANPQLQNPSLIYPGQRLSVPGFGRYVVQPGDTFYRIAQRHNISVQALAAANPQVEDLNVIRPGMVLSIPPRPPQQYIVQPGDTLWAIAQSFGTTVAALLQANPGVNPYQLRIGQRLTIPAASGGGETIVVPREDYGYDEMMADLARLRERYPFIEVSTIGQSVLGRDIPVVRLGTGPKQVHYNAAIHGEEWVTAVLMMKFTEVYARARERGERIGNFDVPALWEQSSLYIVPMVNPDGVEISQEGVSRDNPYYDLLIQANGGSTNFRTWAANARGVDLNNQFPAGWEREAARGPRSPAPRNYSGTGPLTEPEAIALADFTRAHDFRLVIAWHSQGEEIYWGYEGLEPPESEQITNLFADISGYRPVRYLESWAGYKDWFIQDWRRPGFTIEVGRGVNPLPMTQFWPIWSRTIGVMLAGLAV